MQRLLPTLLAALLATTAARAQTLDDVDVDVSSGALGWQLPSRLRTFDSDWTANRLLATAFVEVFGKSDRLVVATYDPSTGLTDRLAEFDAHPWRVTEVSLAVPPNWESNPDMNRIYVAFSAQVEVQPSKQTPAAQIVQTVRLLSVEIGSGKARIADCPGLKVLPNQRYAEAPHPQVCVLTKGLGYSVELAFIDPNGTPPAGWRPGDPLGDKLMYTRSTDFGRTLEQPLVVAGSSAALAPKGAVGVPPNRFSKLGLAPDENNRLTLFALEDVTAKVVRVASKAAGDAHLVQVDATPSDTLWESAPRIACFEGRFNVTCLRRPQYASQAELAWFTGNVYSAMIEMDVLSHKAATEGDIEVYGSKAYVTARVYPDQGSVPVVTVFEAERKTRNGFQSWQIDDAGSSDLDPRCAVVPTGTLAPGTGKYKSQVWMRPGAPGALFLDL